MLRFLCFPGRLEQPNIFKMFFVSLVKDFSTSQTAKSLTEFLEITTNMNNIDKSDILVAEMLQLPRSFHRWEARFYDG